MQETELPSEVADQSESQRHTTLQQPQRAADLHNAGLPSHQYGDRIRVATYNVNWGNRRGDQVIDAITTADADVLCLQETTQQSEQFLKLHLAYQYPVFHSVGHDGEYAAERFALASKTELADLTFYPPDAGLFGFCSATIQLGNVRVRIINVHLSPVLMRGGFGIRQAFEAFADAEAKHAAEIDGIVRTIDLDQPTIVVGDFNSLSNFCAPRRLVQLGFQDAFASMHKSADEHATWHWPTSPVPLAFRIDYIFHSSHLMTTKSEIVRRDGSDHYLVFADLNTVQDANLKAAPPATSDD